MNIKTASLLIVASCSVACSPGPYAELTSDDSKSEYKVALSEKDDGQFELLVSSPISQQELGVCFAKEDQMCSTTSETYTKLDPVRKIGERSLYSSAELLRISSEGVVTLIDNSNEVKRRFKLIAKDASGDKSNDLSDALALVTKEALREDLTYLTRDEWKGRLSGTKENDAAADWLIREIKKIGLLPGNNNNFKQAFRIPKLGGAMANNIIGIIPSQDPSLKDEFILIGAHMDHAGTLSRGYTCSRGQAALNDICNGADDNGSGTVSLLNIARGLVKIKAQLKRSVVIMWFAGEEEGLVGSRHFVENPTIPLRQIKLMINMDMVGYLRQNNNTLMAIGTTANRSEYKVAEKITAKYGDIELRAAAKAQGGSDHAPFMGKGIPAIFFHTGVSSNPNYHKTSDTADKIDYDGMEKIGRIALETLYTINTDVSTQGFSLTSSFGKSLLPPEELEKSCHHLIEVEEKFYSSLDFSENNDGILN